MQPPLETILVVEDDEDLALLQRKSLERRGYSVFSSSTTENALAVIQSQQIDVVISDARLLGSAAGQDLCSRMCALGSTSPAVLVIDFDAESNVSTETGQDLRGFTPKAPESLQSLPDNVERALRARRALRNARMERQLAEREACFQLFMGNSPVAAFIKDEAGRLLYANLRAQQFLGRNDWQGKTDSQLWPSETAARLRENDLAVFRGLGQSQFFETVADSNGALRHILSYKFVMGDWPGLRRLGWMAVDLTQLHVTEDALRETKEKLQQAQKMETVGQLASGVAHDFNNLLTVIIGYCDTLLTNHDLGAENRQFLLEIFKTANKAGSFARQMLAINRKLGGTPRQINLNEIVTDMESILRRVAGEEIQVSTMLSPDLHPVWAEPVQIEQVLLNLVSNARDAMSRGALTIETGNVERGGEYVQSHPDVQPGRYVALAVSDTGCGMDETTKARIFEPFFTTKKPGTGSGLGLATVWNIIQQNGGHVEVQSEVGRGSTFSVYLPVKETELRHESTAVEYQVPLRGSETILLVEDEESVSELCRHALQRYGYHVLEAHHSADAIELSKAHRGDIHLLITDVALPQCSGPQLAEVIQAQRPALKVLFVSGNSAESVVPPQGMQRAEMNFLQKPFTFASMARIVRKILDTRPAPLGLASSRIPRSSVPGGTIGVSRPSTLPPSF